MTRGRLNSGEEIPYAFGLEFRQYKGHPDVEHNGFMIQFTADMVRFPKERLSIIVLGNIADQFATDLAYQVADLYLDPTPSAPLSPVGNPISTVALTPDQLQRFTGYYWNGAGNFYRRAVLKEGQLFLDWGEGTGGEHLLPVGETKFALLNQDNQTAEPPVYVSFAGREAGNRRMVIASAGQSGGSVFDRYDPTPPLHLAELEPYVGDYYSDDLETTYRFEISDGKFILRIGNGAPLILFPQPDPGIIWNAKDRFFIGFGEVIFQKDATGHVTGFQIGDQRVSAIPFAKMGTTNSR